MRTGKMPPRYMGAHRRRGQASEIAAFIQGMARAQLRDSTTRDFHMRTIIRSAFVLGALFAAPVIAVADPDTKQDAKDKATDAKKDAKDAATDAKKKGKDVDATPGEKVKNKADAKKAKADHAADATKDKADHAVDADKDKMK
jgi:hypothetical protein